MCEFVTLSIVGSTRGDAGMPPNTNFPRNCFVWQEVKQRRRVRRFVCNRSLIAYIYKKEDVCRVRVERTNAWVSAAVPAAHASSCRHACRNQVKGSGGK